MYKHKFECMGVVDEESLRDFVWFFDGNKGKVVDSLINTKVRNCKAAVVYVESELDPLTYIKHISREPFHPLRKYVRYLHPDQETHWEPFQLGRPPKIASPTMTQSDGVSFKHGKRYNTSSTGTKETKVVTETIRKQGDELKSAMQETGRIGETVETDSKFGSEGWAVELAVIAKDEHPTNKSAQIRFMSQQGVSKSWISKLLNVSYQQVFGVVKKMKG